MILTISTFLCLYLSSKLFDYFWKTDCSILLDNIGDIYNPPKEYENLTKVRLRLINKRTLFLEGNKRFKLKDSNKEYSFYDTVNFNQPDTSYGCTNKIFFIFKNSEYFDSIYIVVSKTSTNDIYWNQIFYSSVPIAALNQSSDDSTEFRIDTAQLVPKNILINNDSTIKLVYAYYNNGKDSLKFGDCTANSELFQKICTIYNVPCRKIGLMGGDATDYGWNSSIGYPSHELCEIYSSREKKWIIVDPSFGLTYRKEHTNLNAVEICNKVFFMTENEIQQDSVLFTKRSKVGSDYYKYFENVFYHSSYRANPILEKILQHFFKRFNYNIYHYSNSYLITKNGYYYVGVKLLIYGLIIIININIVFYILLSRLYKIRRMKPKLKQITNE